MIFERGNTMTPYEELKKIEAEIEVLEEKREELESSISGYYIGYVQESQNRYSDDPDIQETYILIGHATEEKAKKYMNERYEYDISVVRYDWHVLNEEQWHKIQDLKRLQYACGHILSLSNEHKTQRIFEISEELYQDQIKIVEELCETLPENIKFVREKEVPTIADYPFDDSPFNGY